MLTLIVIIITRDNNIQSNFQRCLLWRRYPATGSWQSSALSEQEWPTSRQGRFTGPGTGWLWRCSYIPTWQAFPYQNGWISGKATEVHCTWYRTIMMEDLQHTSKGRVVLNIIPFCHTQTKNQIRQERKKLYCLHCIQLKMCPIYPYSQVKYRSSVNMNILNNFWDTRPNFVFVSVFRDASDNGSSVLCYEIIQTIWKKWFGRKCSIYLNNYFSIFLCFIFPDSVLYCVILHFSDPNHLVWYLTLPFIIWHLTFHNPNVLYYYKTAKLINL